MAWPGCSPWGFVLKFLPFKHKQKFMVVKGQSTKHLPQAFFHQTQFPLPVALGLADEVDVSIVLVF